MHSPMAYKPSPAQPPSALLRQVRPLRLLLNQAERLEHLQRLLESQLQPAAASTAMSRHGAMAPCCWL